MTTPCVKSFGSLIAVLSLDEQIDLVACIGSAGMMARREIGKKFVGRPMPTTNTRLAIFAATPPRRSPGGRT